jgi:hypothetical protein
VSWIGNVKPIPGAPGSYKAMDRISADGVYSE